MTKDDAVVVDFTPSGKPVTHGGSGTAYAHYGCRCAECVEANTRRCKRRRNEREQEGPVRHGLSGYINWGCRCDVCRASGSAANHTQYLRRKARAVLAAPVGGA